MAAKKVVQKIVLVNPYYQKLTKSVSQISVGPPLGLAYIAAVLEQNGYKISIIDANAESLSPREVIKRILPTKADLVGFSAVTPTIYLCHQIAEEVKKQDDSIITIIGGVHVTALPEETLMKFNGFDFVIRGEGEYVFLELLRALNNSITLSKIKGLGYRKNGKIIINELQDSIEDLNKLPFPARHLLNNSLYRTFDSTMMTTVIAMRGCPAKCIYCAVNLVAGKKCRQRSPVNVINEIRQCFIDYGARFIAFLDDTFTYNKSWVHDLCAEFIVTGLNRQIKWSCLTRVDNVDLSLLKHMKQAGCVRVEFGIESGAQKFLDFLKKGITVQQIKEAFAMAKKTGLSTMGFVMLGIPGETKTNIAETKRLIMEVEPDFLQISFATPYPGTELFAICQRDSLLLNKDWSQYIFLRRQIIKNGSITEEKYKKIRLALERSFYLRPKYLFMTMIQILKNPIIIKPMFWAGLNAFKNLLFKDKAV